MESDQLEIIYPKASEEYKINDEFKNRALEINKLLNMSLTNVIVVVLLKPCLSSITNVEYIDIGSEITCSTTNNKSPNKTAPRTSDEVVETTTSLRKLNNPPKVKIINTTAPKRAVKI